MVSQSKLAKSISGEVVSTAIDLDSEYGGSIWANSAKKSYPNRLHESPQLSWSWY